jgi:hypothetical protein
MDGDWDTPELTADQAGGGNPSIQETNVTTIAELKNQYKTIIETDYRNGTAYAQITDDVQIKAVVTGNDISGNIYNEIVVDDGTGAIIIAVSEGGLFGNLPVGAEVLIDLKGLYIGGYGMQAELGTPYTNSGSNLREPYESCVVEPALQADRREEDRRTHRVQLFGKPLPTDLPMAASWLP